MRTSVATADRPSTPDEPQQLAQPEWLQFASHLARKNLLNSKFLGIAADPKPGSKSLRDLFDSTRLNADEYAREIASFYRLRRFGLRELLESSPLIENFSYGFLRENAVFPCRFVATEKAFLVLANPLDRATIEAAQAVLGQEVSIAVASADDIATALSRCSEEISISPPEPGAAAPQDVLPDVEGLRDLASGAPVVRALNELFEKAMELRATDIHIEPFRNGFNVRLRIDGVMRTIPSPGGILPQALLSRIKIVAGLNIAERRLPQDGGAHINVGRSSVDFRVATMPTKFGESAVVRLLPKDATILQIANLGFGSSDRARLMKLLQLPHGMVVVTGPTGSGKTTTLATMLHHLNDSTRKILTIEDPIEYEIQGINQSQVKPEIGLTFATALRSFVRQDPDVIMVGEIRDQETARIAVHAALTGHLVLTTLHTETAAAAVPRLLDLGVEPFLLQSTLRGTIAQRLARVLCERCKHEVELNARTMAADPRHAMLGFKTGDRVFEPRGCESCAGVGYRGRTGLFEVLTVDDAVREHVSSRTHAGKIAAAAKAGGMTTMVDDGIAKCRQGITSIPEVLRVAALG